MGRVYSIPFANVSVAAVQDLIAIYAGSSKAFRLHSFQIGQITNTTVQNLRLSINRLPATVTAGSGGTTPALNPAQPNDTAATITAHANDTTQATTSGTKAVMLADVFNTVNGYIYLPPGEDRIVVGPNQALSISLDTAPASAMNMSGTAVVEELF
jgi:hypothetical protein